MEHFGGKHTLSPLVHTIALTVVTGGDRRSVRNRRIVTSVGPVVGDFCMKVSGTGQ